ncbi:hypothetical protein Hanom_Chr16g01487191 [Helianthus anomalus]
MVRLTDQVTGKNSKICSGKKQIVLFVQVKVGVLFFNRHLKTDPNKINPNPIMVLPD